LEFVTVFGLTDVFVTTNTSTLLHSNGTIFGYPGSPLHYKVFPGLFASLGRISETKW
jgi:hypothetical protein